MKQRLTRILSFVMLLIMLCSVTACSVQLRPFGPQETTCDHEFVTTESTATCTEPGEVISSCTKCGKIVREEIPALGHDYVTVEPRAATCTVPGVRNAYEGCSRCAEGLTEENTIPALGHDYVEHPAQAATCTEAGWGAYRTCSRCDFTDYTEIPPAGHTFVAGVCTGCGALEYSIYASSAGYDALGSVAEKGTALQALYRAIDAGQTGYLTSTGDIAPVENGGQTYYPLDTYEAEGLSADEMRAVWSAYRADHPMYFWIGANCLVSTGSQNAVILATDAKYAVGETRAAMVKTVLAGLSGLLEGVPTAGDYDIALYLHDRIIAKVDYAYVAGTTDAEDTLDAHSVAGCFFDGRVVCEGYAKLFEACLNARGVENRFVTGTANGGGHAWNLVRIGDAGWYWCDLTWDDAPEKTSGRLYNYFLKTDGENTGGSADGGYTYGDSTFAGTHTPGDATLGIAYQYPLPARAETPVGESGQVEGVLLLRGTVNVEGAIYARVGAEEVQLTALASDAAGEVTIPAGISLDGMKYRVVAIGAQNEKGLFGSGAIAEMAQSITSVTLPSTLRTVWYGALALPTLTEIKVNGGTSFRSIGGVLYSGDGKVLVQYPFGMDASGRFDMPGHVQTVASGAFGYVGADGTVKAAHLSVISLGKALEYFGVRERGYGYSHNAETRKNTAQELGLLVLLRSGVLTFLLSSGAQEFVVAGDGEVLSKDETVLYLVRNRLQTDVTEYTIGADVTAIADYAFVTAPNLTSLSFAGTVEAFEALVENSGSLWASGLKVTSVTCLDGTYTVR